MADIIPNVVVSMPSQLFTLARSFKAAANGKIYIGKIDTDPTIPSNQIQVYIQNENETPVPINQPIIINQAGFPTYGGQISRFVTQQGHSMAVYDAYGVQQFYFSNVIGYDPDQFGPDFVDKLAQTGAYANDNTKGDAMVGVVPSFTGSARRTQHDKNSDSISALDIKGMLPDGSTNVTSVFSSFEGVISGREIDLCGKTYRVDPIPTGNTYFNGSWNTTVDGVLTVQKSAGSRIREWGNVISIGDGLASMTQQNATNHAVISIGKDSLKNATDAQDTIAIGFESMMNSIYGAYGCVGVGYRTLKNAQPSSAASDASGTRNTAVGGLSQLFTTTGTQNASFGRNSGSSITTGIRNTHIGTNAGLGWCPVGFDGNIVNNFPMTGTATLIGHGSGERNQGSGNTFVGVFSGNQIKQGINNTLIGEYALAAAELPNANNGKLYSKSTSTSGSYTQVGNVVTVTASGNGAVAGAIASLSLDGSDQNKVTVDSVIDANTFTCTINVSQNRSGTALVGWTATLTDGVYCNQNNVLGRYSLQNMTTGSGNVAVGDNVAVGLTSATNSVFLGRRAGSVILGGDPNTSFGDNVVAIGNVAPLSGNNQFQLGNSAQTVYYYQMVQRSDIRDKANDRPTTLGLDFVRRLEFKDWQWDMREDYVNYKESKDGDLIAEKLPKDGSKTRKRWHSGVIAQQVKKVLDELGVDSGIHQDQSVDGGADVQSVAYNELIAPIGRAVQEVDAELAIARKELSEALQRIKHLEDKNTQ